MFWMPSVTLILRRLSSKWNFTFYPISLKTYYATALQFAIPPRSLNALMQFFAYAPYSVTTKLLVVTFLASLHQWIASSTFSVGGVGSKTVCGSRPVKVCGWFYKRIPLFNDILGGYLPWKLFQVCKTYLWGHSYSHSYQGSVRCEGKRKSPPISWIETKASKFRSGVTSTILPESLWRQGLSLTAQSGDQCSIFSWVFARDNQVRHYLLFSR